MLCAIALFAQLQSAEPVGPQVARGVVQWDAPASCPAHDEVVAAIAARVPLDAVGVRARVEQHSDELVAEVTIDSEHGTTQRRLQSPSCASLVDALVLLAQVAAEPSPDDPVVPPPQTDVTAQTDVAAQTDATETAADTASAQPVSTPAVAQAPTPPPRRGAEARARIAVAAVVGGGTLPVIDLGIRGVVGVATRWIHADVGALYLGPRPVDVSAPNVTVKFDAWGIVARACPVIPLPLQQLELTLCAVGTAGRVRGHAAGEGVHNAGSATQPWVRLAAAPELAVVLHPRVRVVASVEAGGHIVRPGFTIDGLGQIWAPRPWAVHGLAGVELRFP